MFRKLALACLVVLSATSAFAQGSATNLAPVATQSVSVATTAGGQVLVLPNASRKALRICNVTITNAIWICPAPIVALASAAGCFLIPPATATLVQCFTEPLVAGIGIGAQWNAIAVTGAANATVLEY